MDNDRKYEWVLWLVNNFDKVGEYKAQGEYILENELREQIIVCLLVLLDITESDSNE